MYQVGRIAVYLGILLITAGILVGFGAMWLGADGQAINWLGIIPIGFIVLLVGTVLTQLSTPDKDKHRPDMD